MTRRNRAVAEVRILGPKGQTYYFAARVSRSDAARVAAELAAIARVDAVVRASKSSTTGAA